MTKKDYELIASAIWRANFIKDKNATKRIAIEKFKNLLIAGLCSDLGADNPLFNADKFRKACNGL